MHFRWLRDGVAVSALVLATALAPTHATGAEHDEAILATAETALFHLDVTGKLAEGAVDDARHGKAFAIAPNILLTSSHVIGEYSEWLRLDRQTIEGRTLLAPIRRAARPIHRTLRVTGRAELTTGTDQVIAHPAPSPAVDAASLTIPTDEMALQDFFTLSLCPIDKEQTYAALMTTQADPTNAGSIEVGDLRLFSLTPVGFNPVEFGGLYAFTIENDPPKAAMGVPGHAGSPIFDADGNIAAFVSAFLQYQNEDMILATPIQPIIPGTSRLLAEAPVSYNGSHALKCSLASTVKEINDDVTSHADWSIFVPRDREGKVNGDIELRYRSVSARPNIEAINVQFDFAGMARSNARRETLLPLVPGSANLDEPITAGDSDPRMFEVGQLFIEGLKIEDQPDLARKGGFISSVDLYITPILRDGREGRPAEFSFPWKVEADE